MRVERVFIGRPSDGAQLDCESVSLVAGKGIQGDRYFGRQDEPGQNLSLIEIEVLEAFIQEQGREHDLSLGHRNVVTSGVRLNGLVGKQFSIGEVSLRGVELCEPCLGMGKALATPEFPAETIVKRFVHQGGLRADVLSDGVIARGSKIHVAE